MAMSSWNRVVFSVLLVYQGCQATAQNYQAVHGSSYAGSLGMHANPASIVHVPYKWDITPLALQLKQSTNAFQLVDYSLLSSPAGLLVQSEQGTRKRFAFANQDIRLLHARVRLSPKHTIGFGASLRSFAYFKTSAYNWQDTVTTLRDFMDLNTVNTPLSGELRASNWIEFAGTYARTLRDDGRSLLNGGITLKYNKNISGAFANASDLSYTPDRINGVPVYQLQSGSLQYGYSANVDAVDSNADFATNRRRFLQNTLSTVSADIGVEYILPAEIEGDEDNLYTYDWKIGVSVLDIGYNSFRYGRNSRQALAGKANIFDTVLRDRFGEAGSFDNLVDSLESIAAFSAPLTGRFHIMQPTRLVVNADKHIMQDFFINASLTLPLVFSGKNTLLAIRDMNFLAITPRYETRRWGVYMPFTFTAQQQFWVGGAFKAGPVLMGLHNWANLFSKNKMHRGGFYIAFTIRPGQGSDEKNRNRQKLSPALRRSLDCPSR